MTSHIHLHRKEHVQAAEICNLGTQWKIEICVEMLECSPIVDWFERLQLLQQTRRLDRANKAQSNRVSMSELRFAVQAIVKTEGACFYWRSLHLIYWTDDLLAQLVHAGFRLSARYAAMAHASVSHA